MLNIHYLKKYSFILQGRYYFLCFRDSETRVQIKDMFKVTQLVSYRTSIPAEVSLIL